MPESTEPTEPENDVPMLRCAECGSESEPGETDPAKLHTHSCPHALRCAVALNCTAGPEEQWFQVVEAHTASEHYFCPRHALCAELLTGVLGHLGSECPELIRLVERGRS